MVAGVEIGGLNESEGDVLGFRGGGEGGFEIYGGFFVGGVLDVGGLGIYCVVWVVLVRISEAGGFSVGIMMRSINCLCAIVYDRSKPAHV